MKIIKICEECYQDSVLLVEKDDIIIIVDIIECDIHNKVEE